MMVCNAAAHAFNLAARLHLLYLASTTAQPVDNTIAHLPASPRPRQQLLDPEFLDVQLRCM
jgi:hypothetical protein